jgi:hypothetical protein
MKGRWRFRVVQLDGTAAYATAQGGQPLEHAGTDEEALAISRQVWEQNPTAQRVEVVSVGCPSGISDTPGRLLAIAQERADQQGWTLMGELMSGTWHSQLKEAVSYGAFRARENLSEIRIVNVRGEVTHVVLIDQRDHALRQIYGQE